MNKYAKIALKEKIDKADVLKCPDRKFNLNICKQYCAY